MTPDVQQHLEILETRTAVVSAGIFNGLGASWQRNHGKQARTEHNDPPNRPTAFDDNLGEMIKGSGFMGYAFAGSLGLTKREFLSNKNHKMNLDTKLFEFVENGERIPVDGMIMFRETASRSDQVILKMFQTIMARYRSDPGFMLKKGYFDDVNGGVGVACGELLFDLDFFHQGVGQEAETAQMEGYGPIYLLSDQIEELVIPEGATSFTIAGFNDFCELWTPADLRQVFSYRMRFRKRTGKFAMTNLKVLWRSLYNESQGLTRNFRNPALSSLLNESTLNNPIFFHRDSDNQLPSVGILQGHWALQAIRENYTRSTVPRVAGILGLDSHADLFSTTNRGNRVMVPVGYERKIPTMGYPSGSAYHPDCKPFVHHPELEEAIGNFLFGLADTEVQPNRDVYLISRCAAYGVHGENREIKIITVKDNFDDLSSLQIMAETMPLIQDTENRDLGFFD